MKSSSYQGQTTLKREEEDLNEKSKTMDLQNYQDEVENTGDY